MSDTKSLSDDNKANCNFVVESMGGAPVCTGHERFVELDIDELELHDLALDIESEFNIRITEHEVNSLDTVQQLYDLVAAKLD